MMEKNLKDKVNAALKTLDPQNTMATEEEKCRAWGLINEIVGLMLGN
jgi:hypothetical protein